MVTKNLPLIVLGQSSLAVVGRVVLRDVRLGLLDVGEHDVSDLGVE